MNPSDCLVNLEKSLPVSCQRWSIWDHSCVGDPSLPRKRAQSQFCLSTQPWIKNGTRTSSENNLHHPVYWRWGPFSAWWTTFPLGKSNDFASKLWVQGQETAKLKSILPVILLKSITGWILEVRKEWEQFSRGEVVLFLGSAHQPETRPLRQKDASLWCRKYSDKRKYTVHKSHCEGRTRATDDMGRNGKRNISQRELWDMEAFWTSFIIKAAYDVLLFPKTFS